MKKKFVYRPRTAEQWGRRAGHRPKATAKRNKPAYHYVDDAILIENLRFKSVTGNSIEMLYCDLLLRQLLGEPVNA